MTQLLQSFIRTAVPSVVGLVVAFLASNGITLPDDTLANLNAFLSVGISLLYYIVVRVIEVKVPKAGWLLGIAKQPVYARDTTAYSVPDTTPGVVDNKVKETK